MYGSGYQLDIVLAVKGWSYLFTTQQPCTKTAYCWTHFNTEASFAAGESSLHNCEKLITLAADQINTYSLHFRI